MNPENSRLRQQERVEPQHSQAHGSAQKPLEFASVEDLLRHDSSQHPVPPEVAERLGFSISAEPKPPKSWFRRLFG